MCQQQEGPQNGGFTLIELLVVIGIIALLLSIIIPSLQHAKNSARQVVCAAQMKQWGLATSAYISENNETVPVYSDVCDPTNSENPLDSETIWYNRLASYLTEEDYGKWGMETDVRRCPMSRADWGEKAVWIGVYYGKYQPENAPFVQPYRWTNSTLERKCKPVRFATIRRPTSYLMMLDVRRTHVFDPIHWAWDTDYDGDGDLDSLSGLLSKGAYNNAQPKIHRNGCNVTLFDGHVEWISYETFWEVGSDGYPVHPFWWNRNRP